MLSPTTIRERLLLYVLAICAFTFFIGWLLGGLILAFAVAGVNIAVLYIARNIWLSEKGNYMLRMAVLGIVSAVVVGSNSAWQPFLHTALQSLFPKVPIPDFSVSALTYGFLLALVSIVFYLTRDKTALGKSEVPLNAHIKVPDFTERIKMVCISLADDIRDIDRKTNWSAQYYTPLEAEVEMQTKNGRKKVVADLLKAIKNTDDRLILLLGEPGSGKSVSLRKLCMELTAEKEVLKSQKIPVYINLKEWKVDREWTEEHPPTVQDLEQFVIQNLKSRDRVTSDFFDEHFSALYESGNLFFAFDSFDEIPAVLGTSHNSELINQLSIVFRQFLKGARQPKAQGILSSREFRKPTDAFGAKTTLLVRPFTTDKIVKTLQRSGKILETTIQQLFKERLDLVPLARNPFTAALLSEFITQDKSFPKNQSELYESYLFRTLKTSFRDKLMKKKLTAEEVFAVSGKIGEFIFDKYGLEAPIDELRNYLHSERLDDIIEILEFARIGRKSSGDANMFSFSHRRFVEYFAVQKILREQELVDLYKLDIPEDSRSRDMMVLYCEVAPFEKAKEVANYCWKVIKLKNNLQDYDSMHALRFMTDAFRGRKECLVDFVDELSSFILSQIDGENNVFSVKYAAESLTLLPEVVLEEGAIKCYKIKNAWIDEITLRASRHLNSISESLERLSLNRFIPSTNELSDFIVERGSYFSSKHYHSYIQEKKEILFSLSLSEAYISVFKIVKTKVFFLERSIAPCLISSLILLAYIAKEKPDRIPLLIFILFIIVMYPIVTFGAFICYKIIEDIFLVFYFYKISYYKKHSFFYRLLQIFSVTRQGVLETISEIPYVFGAVLSILICLFLIYSAFPIKIADTILTTSFIALYVSIMGRSGIFAPFIEAYKYVISYIKYINIIYEKCNNREYIYHIYFDLVSYHKNRFLTYLENNISSVEGEWPNQDFLQAKEGHIRLAKLEEKWRGLAK